MASLRNTFAVLQFIKQGQFRQSMEALMSRLLHRSSMCLSLKNVRKVQNKPTADSESDTWTKRPDVRTTKRFHANVRKVQSEPTADSESERDIWTKRPVVRITKPFHAVEASRKAILDHELRSATLSQRPIITAHQSKFNFYGDFGRSTEKTPRHKKSLKMEHEVVPQRLASGGWKSRHAKGDYFTINAVSNAGGNQNNMFFEYCDDSKTSNSATLQLSSSLVKNFSDLNIQTLTDIQQLAIPAILLASPAAGDIVLASETGSGKTLAFLLPVLDCLIKTRASASVILVPARELAHQIADVARRATRSDKDHLVDVCVVLNEDNVVLDNNRSVLIISTPVNFLRWLNSSNLSLKIQHLVLDEADSLLDDSFYDDIVKVLVALRSEKSPRVIYSASTMPTRLEVNDQKGSTLISSQRLQVLKTPRLHRLMQHISHKFIRCGAEQKTEHVVELVRKSFKRHFPVVVFCNKSRAVSFVAALLVENGLPADSIAVLDGKLTIEDRDANFEAFFVKRSKVILVATDLASRGLDTPPNVKNIINFDCPHHMSDYIHRAGRIGRASSNGKFANQVVTTLVTYPEEVELVQRIEAATRQSTGKRGGKLPEVDGNIKRQYKQAAESRLAEAEIDAAVQTDREQKDAQLEAFLTGRQP